MGQKLDERLVVGLACGAIFCILPLPRLSERLIGISAFPGFVLAGLVGLGLGYGATSMLPLVRRQLLKRLLTYQGWLTNQKSLKTKAWALLMKLCRMKNETTFMYQDMLPKLPVPSLEETLRRYMESIKPLLDAQDFDYSKKVILEFQQKDGQVLQKYIEDRYKKTRNWLSDWWMTAAYMSGRYQLPINSNFYMMHNVLPEVTTNQLARAANILYYSLKFYENNCKGVTPVMKIQKMVPMCMDGLNTLFGTARIPSSPVDYMQTTNSQSKHFVVIRNGSFYRVESYAYDMKAGEERLLSVEELYNQLEIIQTDKTAPPEDQTEAVAALTSQERDVWAKQREKLLQDETNKATLETIESAVIILSFDNEDAGDISQQAKVIFTGDGKTRWFDKALSLVVHKDGKAGINVEHAAADATHLAQLTEYYLSREKYTKAGHIITSATPARTLEAPKRLLWKLDGFKEDINVAQEKLMQMKEMIDTYIFSPSYGKGFPKSVRLSPDGYFQMIIQLAYWRLHKEVVLTYESASTRLFGLGRTETVRPHSETSRKWVESMDNPNISKEERVSLLRKSILYQNKYRLECTGGYGCDRHLLGMLMASMELGMEKPKLYQDKAWQFKYKLSTSQTPTDIVKYNLPLDHNSLNGGFGPTAEDGYGIAYVVLDDLRLNFNVTCWKQSGLSAREFGDALNQAMLDMRAIFQ
ncbi:unnamed protein product [Owenia fusiformis]|uniref:Uncharacterized protein n=1 Tax=Owenia fusiformis TaxID=6347 RepID=A0A8J1XWK1_OWEFU|nr:unnamed protein product [Owenia fusiformis]